MKAKLIGILLLTLLLAPLAHATATNKTATISMYSNDQPPSGQNALRKLGRGFSNLLFGIVEVPNQFTKAVDANGGAAVPYGLGKGIYRWFEREFVGVYEIITFPIPAPRGYEPIMKPEWPNEDYEP
jgi:putative exosortase-associated protein (TIGR04073 family)